MVPVADYPDMAVRIDQRAHGARRTPRHLRHSIKQMCAAARASRNRRVYLVCGGIGMAKRHTGPHRGEGTDLVRRGRFWGDRDHHRKAMGANTFYSIQRALIEATYKVGGVRAASRHCNMGPFNMKPQNRRVFHGNHRISGCIKNVRMIGNNSRQNRDCSKCVVGLRNLAQSIGCGRRIHHHSAAAVDLQIHETR